jgi:hypothetical protein
MSALAGAPRDERTETVADDPLVEQDLAAIEPVGPGPHPAARLLVALVVAALAGLLTIRWFEGTPIQPDYWFPHMSARALKAGVNPYLLPVDSPEWPMPMPMFFPLPAAVLAWPTAGLPLPLAGGIFVAISSGALSWFVTRHSLLRALLFVGGSFLVAARLGQWSTALCLILLLPGAGWLAAAKPTIGLAMLAARPSWRGFILPVVFGALCLLVLPTWPLDWLRVIRSGDAVGLHMTPVATVWGWPLLLTVLRWRRPEARLLLAMACVPQMPLFYDQVALALVARTRLEIVAYSTINFVGWVLWMNVMQMDWGPPHQKAALPYFVLATYLPAFILVMLKPNQGATPDWLGWLSRVVAGARRHRPAAL